MDTEKGKVHWRRRLFIMSGVAVLHSICYYFFVRAVNEQRPPSELLNLRTLVDNWIPYLGWTWFFYYLGDFYILFFGAYVVWKLPKAKFLQSAWVYTVMIISGALFHIALPSKSPWPTDLINVQRWFHNSISVNPFACLPSMHVALTILPACIALSILKSSWLKSLSFILAALITISTLTLKEHYFLDTLTGILFALLFYVIWRLDFKALFKRNIWSWHGNRKG